MKPIETLVDPDVASNNSLYLLTYLFAYLPIYIFIYFYLFLILNSFLFMNCFSYNFSNHIYFVVLV